MKNKSSIQPRLYHIGLTGTDGHFVVFGVIEGSGLNELVRGFCVARNVAAEPQIGDFVKWNIYARGLICCVQISVNEIVDFDEYTDSFESEKIEVLIKKLRKTVSDLQTEVAKLRNERKDARKYMGGQAERISDLNDIIRKMIDEDEERSDVTEAKSQAILQLENTIEAERCKHGQALSEIAELNREIESLQEKNRKLFDERSDRIKLINDLRRHRDALLNTLATAFNNE